MSIEYLETQFNKVAHFKYLEVPDSEYLKLNMVLEGCSNVIYLQNNFIINNEVLMNEARQLPKLHALYSSRVYFQGKERELKDLNRTDLATLSQLDLAQYVLIFDAKFLRYITPLNFAYFNKFILEEILILPLLALLQKSARLVSFNSLGHAVEEEQMQFKEFPLANLKENKEHVCFVAYPSNPYELNEKQVEGFADSLKAMSKDKASTSLVVSMPYSFNSNSSVWSSFRHLIKLDPDFAAIRLRIWGDKSVSSLNVYEAAHTYCPNKAVIVSSRFNVRFNEQFYSAIAPKIQEAFHYYTVDFTNEEGKQVDFSAVNEYSDAVRIEALHFRSHFQPVQIFKSDLLKMHYMQILKCAEIDFYETEASFVIPMLETVRLHVMKIRQNLFTVEPRQKTPVEEQQIKNLGLYWEWQGMLHNVLRPRNYNSLANEAFRRNAPPRIQKNIHQLWLSKEEVSPIRKKLHETLKEKNPEYKMYLWTYENVTRDNFPMTYPIIQSILDREKEQKASSKSAISDLVRY